MNIKELLFVVGSIVFVLFCIWYAVSEFGKSLDGFNPVQVEEIEVNKRDGTGKIYTVQGRWNDGALVLERGK